MAVLKSLLISIAAASTCIVPVATARELTFEERVKARTAIEGVYWSHRIWPRQNGEPKPPLSRVMPDPAIRAKVEDDLRKSNALGKISGRPVTAAELQREMDRMVVETRRPDVLRELFAVLGNDPFAVAETLARPLLVDRRLRAAYEREPGPKLPFDAWWASERTSHARSVPELEASFTLRSPAATGCVPDTWTPMQSGAPAPRNQHSVVWTGSEMIVWGGTSGLFLNSGGRYDPATSTWTPISTGANVPPARVSHTAIWTGSEMIVWGGSDQHGTQFNEGGRYDPATDTWKPTSTGTGCPGVRSGHTAVWTGSTMIVWGGSSRQGEPYLAGGRYVPATDTWTSIASGPGAPTNRSRHTAVWTGTQMLVWGGYGDQAYLNSGGRYDPGTDSWTPMSLGAGVPIGRSGHTTVWTGTEMIVWGGYVGGGGYLNSGGRYDPTSDTWAPTSLGAGVPVGRDGHTAVWTGTEMIVWGGYTGSPYLNSGGRYDPLSDSWTSTSLGDGVPLGRSGHTAVWTGTEMIVWGGYGTVVLSSGGRYDPASDAWSSMSAGGGPPDARSSHAAVWTGAEMIVWGGGGDLRALNSGGRYDPATGSWTPTSTGVNVPSARSSPAAVWTGTEMIVWGGFDGSDDVVTGGRYSPFTDTWTPTSTGANVPEKRGRPSVVWTGTEMIVWGGGGSFSTYRNDGGRYDPLRDSWTPVSTRPGVPAARVAHTAVWAGTEMIVWGGRDSEGYFNSGGRYWPATDTWISTPTTPWAPPPRHSHLAVWTGAEMIVWGGFGNAGWLNSGGRFTPGTESWTPTPTSPPAPDAREGPTAVWTGEEMIVWGGRMENTLPLNTGGRYAPGMDRWSATSSNDPNNPTSRFQHTAVWTGLEMIVWGPDGGGDRYCVVNCTSPGSPADDRDGDGLHNVCDDCPDASDPEQADYDGDRIGDACEVGARAADVDLSRRVDGLDLAIFGRAFGSVDGEAAYDRRADLNRDGRVDGDDLAVMATAWGRSVQV
jgi:N-acetylneuraminic acid mutarotase